MTVALLSARGDPVIYHRLAQRVSAFDKDGDPAVELIEKPPGRFATFANRALAGIPQMRLIITSIAAMIVFVIAIILTLRHRMSIDELLRYLR